MYWVSKSKTKNNSDEFQSPKDILSGIHFNYFSWRKSIINPVISFYLQIESSFLFFYPWHITNSVTWFSIQILISTSFLFWSRLASWSVKIHRSSSCELWCHPVNCDVIVSWLLPLYWVGQKVCSDLSVRSFGKTWMNFLANTGWSQFCSCCSVTKSCLTLLRPCGL